MARKSVLEAYTRAFGPGPYTFAGVGQLDGCSGCDFCGTGIKYPFYFKSPTRTFKLGSECAMQMCDPETKKVIKEEVARRRREATAQAKYMSRKQEIEPYVWALPPSPEHFPLLRHLRLWVDWYEWSQTGIAKPVDYGHGIGKSGDPQMQKDPKVLLRLIDLWNQGERWLTF